MQERQKFSSGAKWEDIVGYSRAIRVGDRIYVTGTTALDGSGNLVGEGDAYAQSVQAIRNIEKVLKRAGATLEHVVRTRMFVTDIQRWEDYCARAMASFSKPSSPARPWSKYARSSIRAC